MACAREIASMLSNDNYVYLLSATLSGGKQDMAEEIFGKFTVSEVSLKSAIDSDILPDPKVYVVGMELDNSLKYQEIKIGNDPEAPVVKWEDRKKYIYKNIPCIIQCTAFQKYTYLTSAMEYWKQRYERSHSEYQRTKWVNLGSQRKRLLGELKTPSVRNLLSLMPRDRRFVCFCASVAQADNLCAKSTISSKKPQKYNQAVIDSFNSRDTSQIFAVGMITEGMNLTDIETGIIVQLDGKERLFVQKVGRALRADSPVVFIFYYKNTQDEVYLNGALENLDQKYIRYINERDLKYAIL
jgi:superfamily II DNA or RNA helicase